MMSCADPSPRFLAGIMCTSDYRFGVCCGLVFLWRFGLLATVRIATCNLIANSCRGGWGANCEGLGPRSIRARVLEWVDPNAHRDNSELTKVNGLVLFTSVSYSIHPPSKYRTSGGIKPTGCTSCSEITSMIAQLPACSNDRGWSEAAIEYSPQHGQPRP